MNSTQSNFSRAALAALLCLVTHQTQAALMSVSTTAPTVDGADIAQLVGHTDPGGDSGHVWSNRPNQGQSFTTGSHAPGYNLTSVTMLARVDQGSTTSSNWDIRVGTVDGSNVFGAEFNESATGVAIPNTGGTSNPQWVTWTFDTSIMLDANTLYGFDVFPSGGGFISLNNPGDVYAGGTAFSSGDNLPGSPPNPLTLRDYDRVFHLNLEQKRNLIPEPATATCALLGMAGLLRRRRRA